MDRTEFDIVIIGGGIYGCGVAHYLCETQQFQPDRILILESKVIASQASGGLGQRGVRGNGRDESEQPLMSESYKLWPEMMTKLSNNSSKPIDISQYYSTPGSFKILEDPKTMNINPSLFETDPLIKKLGIDANKSQIDQFITSLAKQQTDLGVTSIPILDKSQLYTMEPTLSTPNGNGATVIGAIHCPQDSIASHEWITRQLCNLSISKGVICKEECFVTRVEYINNGLVKIMAVDESNGGKNIVEFTASHGCFILCNAFVPQLLKSSFNINIPVHPVAPQIVIMEKIDKTLDKDIKPIQHLIGHFQRRLAMKLLNNGDLMISGGHLGKLIEIETKYSFKQYKSEPLMDAVEENIKEAKIVFNGINWDNYKLKGAYVDRLMSVCKDTIPIIDDISHVVDKSNVNGGSDNKCKVICGTGWCGHGWAISPAVCKNLAKWIVDGKKPKIFNPFAIDRFEMNENENDDKSSNVVSGIGVKVAVVAAVFVVGCGGYLLYKNRYSRQ